MMMNENELNVALVIRPQRHVTVTVTVMSRTSQCNETLLVRTTNREKISVNIKCLQTIRQKLKIKKLRNVTCRMESHRVT